jgi:hypothetical protein
MLGESEMGILYRSAIFTILLTTSSLAWSAGVVTSTVEFVQVNANDRAYIMFTTPPTSSPACATDPRMTIDLTGHAGRAAFNMALTAKASGKRLYAAGTGSCYSRYEQVNYMRLL